MTDAGTTGTGAADPPSERTIRFFADYVGTPLWGPGIGPAEPEDLALSPGLVRRLRAFDAYHHRHAPVTDDERCPDDAATAHHRAEERALPAAVAAEIGPGAWVVPSGGAPVRAASAANPAAAAAFEHLVAAEAAERARVAAMRRAGGVFTLHGPDGSVYRPPAE